MKIYSVKNYNYNQKVNNFKIYSKYNLPNIQKTASDTVSFGANVDINLLTKEVEKALELVKKQDYTSRKNFYELEQHCKKELNNKVTIALIRTIKPLKGFRIVEEYFTDYYQLQGKNIQKDKFATILQIFLYDKNIDKLKESLTSDIAFMRIFGDDKADILYQLTGRQLKVRDFDKLIKAVSEYNTRVGKWEYIKNSPYKKILDIINCENTASSKYANAISAVNKQSLTTMPSTPPIKKATLGIKDVERYSYYDEYEKADNELIKFERKQKEILNSGRVLTPEEVAERRQVKATRKAVLDKIEKENKSLVKIREDIKTKEERIEYIEQYVFDRMNISEASALDGLDAFERYGYRRPFSKETHFHTLSTLVTKLNTLPKGHKTDKVLNRFLDIFEKTAKKDSKRYEDNQQLGYVIIDFISYGTNIKKESIIRAIELMKKIADQKMDYERIDTTLYRYAKELCKDADIQKAMNELKEIVKDCPNVTRKSEQEWESMELKELW